MPRRETTVQRENRLLRDGYDTRSYSAQLSQVKANREKLKQQFALVERLRAASEALAGSPGDPREFAAVESLITQVGELKPRHVGPEPFRLMKRARKVLEGKRAVFFKSSARPSTAPQLAFGQHKAAPSKDPAVATAAKRAAHEARLAAEKSAVMRGGSAPRQKLRNRSFSNELGAPMLLSADAVPSFAKSIGAANVSAVKERDFISDAEVFHNLGMQSYNVHDAAASDPQLRKYFRQPAVRKVVAQNNPRRDSNLGWIDDRFYQKSTLREYNTYRNEQWKGGHSKELLSGHTLDWPKEWGGIEGKKSTIEEQGSGLGYW